MDTTALKVYEPLGPDRAGWKPQRFKYWYDHIIDLLLSDPTMTQKAIAARLGKSAAAVGMIMGTDLFKMRYELRKQDQSTALQAKINGKLADVTIAALENLSAIMEQKRTQIPVQELTDLADKALSRLGYGPKTVPISSGATQVNVNVVAPITREQLEASRQKIIDHQAKTEVDVHAPSVLPGGGSSEGESTP